MKRIQRLLLCVLLCLAVLPVSASADTGPKPAVTITVVNAPAGDYYLDLLIQDPGDYPNIDPEDYDPTLLDGLRSWEGEGWWPALLEGTDVPLFGDLTPGEDGTHRFTYHRPAQDLPHRRLIRPGGPRPRRAPSPVRCSIPT